MHRADGIGDAKSELRRHFRSLRRSLPDQAKRSERIWRGVEELDAYRRSRTVMAFTSVAGEPDTSEFRTRAEHSGRRVIVPEDLCLDCVVAVERCPSHERDRARAVNEIVASIELVIVPGLAFSREGDRLGQGGGWYDRFLARLEARSAVAKPEVVGVCFADQLTDDVPTESHDIRVASVVTDAGVFHPRTDN